MKLTPIQQSVLDAFDKLESEKWYTPLDLKVVAKGNTFKALIRRGLIEARERAYYVNSRKPDYPMIWTHEFRCYIKRKG